MRHSLSWFRSLRPLLLVLAGIIAVSARAAAQTPYSHTSASRPLITEDAVTIERHVLEAFLSPVGMGRQNGQSTWSVEPGVAYGLVPRTQVELTVPLGFRDATGGSEVGVAGIDLSALHALNVESRSLPAFAIRATVLIPVGGFGARESRESLKGLATRTFGWGRLHVNHEYTFGSEPAGSSVGASTVAGFRGRPARWTTGVGVDRTFPLRGLLLGAELFARQALDDTASARWNLGTGARYQWTRQITIDIGAATSVSERAREWSLRAGVARTMAVGTLIPGLGRWGGR